MKKKNNFYDFEEHLQTILASGTAVLSVAFLFSSIFFDMFNVPILLNMMGYALISIYFHR